jgi:3-oxoacyl-(acyl-carrier-protein) synthase
VKHRVVVTGIGLRTPLGNTPDVMFESLLAGCSGLRAHPRLELGYEVGAVDFDPDAHFTKVQQKFMDRVSQLAVCAAIDAASQAGLPAPMPPASGVYIGSSLGGLTNVEDHYERFFSSRRAQLMVPGAMLNGPSAHIAIRLGIHGESQTYASACASSTIALGEAFRRLRDGYMQVAIAGGAESCLLPGIMSAWDAMGVMYPPDAFPEGEGCRPFSKDRCGFALSEGACVLVLERLDHALERGAHPLCEIVGYGLSSDARHLINPDTKGQVAAMHHALQDACISASDIGYVNAHGTATPNGDKVEAASLHTVFSDLSQRPAVSGTKSAHGHMLGATGALEFAITALALMRQMLPPTTHWTEGDLGWLFNSVPKQGTPASQLTHAMSNSFGFGGTNAVLIAKRWFDQRND